MDNITRDLIRKYFGLKLSQEKLMIFVRDSVEKTKNELFLQALRLRDGQGVEPKKPPEEKKDM